MSEPEPLYDIRGIPLHEFDVYRIEHFRTSRRRIAYLYKVAVILDGRWYGQDLQQVVMNQRDKIHRYQIGRGDKFEIIDGQMERLPDGGIECFWERKRKKVTT